MVFSSITFVFFFLPITLLSYWLCPDRWRNLLLLALSLFFYAWGEGIYVLLMLLSIAINFCSGILIEAGRKTGTATLWLTIGAGLNLLLLGYFKYANFLCDNLDLLLASWHLATISLQPVRLPIGISFFTFQALSYLVDVHRNKVTAQRSPIKLALYISLFPQLIAGPIVRYQTICTALTKRVVSQEMMVSGIERFLFGLGKKVIFANSFGQVADTIFDLPVGELSTFLAWLGAGCYTLQIYYDFSGYSDMAIGLGRMFGFHFLENFNYPYISRSIREFWRRWHISLSTWLRDYVYIPIGGNQRGVPRTYFNLILVFVLCGLWHGASWTFVVWGLYHGFFLLLERTTVARLQRWLWPPLQLVITLAIVVVGWVIFRSDTLSAALTFIGVLFGGARISNDAVTLSLYLNNKLLFEIGLAILLAAPIYPYLSRWVNQLGTGRSGSFAVAYSGIIKCLRLYMLGAITYYSFISLAAELYNPFIYFRF